MKTPPHHIAHGFGPGTARLALLLVAVLAAPALGAPTPPAADPAGAKARVTEPFREEHAEIRVHLGHIHQMAGELRAAAPAEQQSSMRFVVKFLNEHIRSHAEWEEQVLYPVVDRLANGGTHAFTATMRREHVVVGRWIDELGAEAGKAAPSAETFARRADYVLGLLAAHFECEEEVLLPLIDQGMTAAEFKREVLDKARAH